MNPLQMHPSHPPGSPPLSSPCDITAVEGAEDPTNMPRRKFSIRRLSGSSKKNAKQSKEPLSPEIPIVFSVFFGNLNSSTQRVHHVMFDAKTNGSFFENARTQAEDPRGRLWGPAKYCDVSDASQLKEIFGLSTAHTNRILELWEGKSMKCAICTQERVVALTYQPLCCTYDGYYALADGDRLFGLMLSIAKLVRELASNVSVRNAIGSSGATPYVNALAVPICSPAGPCGTASTFGIAAFLSRIAKGIFEDDDGGDDCGELGGETGNEPRASFSRAVEDQEHVPTSKTTAAANVETDEWEDDDVSDSSEDDLDTGSLGCSSPTQTSPSERLPLRYVAICGQPILNETKDPSLKASRLSCLVFTSRWDSSLLESIGSSSGNEDIDDEPYQIIASFHERFIMESAEFRCAICPGSVFATTMVHRPISFRQSNENSPGAVPLRQTMLKLLQYVGGKLKYPDTNAALGYDGVWHINDFVVPICRRNSVCEETARIAALRFVKAHIAPNMNIMYPDLSPDTDLMAEYWVENSGKIPRLVVDKVGKLALLTGADDSTLKPVAKEIVRNNELIAGIRSNVVGMCGKAGGFKDKCTSTDENSVEAASVVHSFSTDDLSVGSADEPEELCEFTDEIREELERDKGKTYTYTLDEDEQSLDLLQESAGEDTDEEEPGPEQEASWGGCPLSDVSAALVEAGVHDMPLLKPTLTVDLLKAIEEAKDHIKNRRAPE
ncbi:hypothetical protein FQN57_006466 [Myotisia sp. PD_48]|nr:hypothetical protein FQN57_006466 [Myotisia sp. PD_48]